MGGQSCVYASDGSTAQSGCTSSSNDPVLGAGAIVGIVIGSLVGIVLIIFLVVLICKLSRRNSLPFHTSRPPNVYNVPTHRNYHQQPADRRDMYTPTKSSPYSEAPTGNNFYEKP